MCSLHNILPARFYKFSNTQVMCSKDGNFEESPKLNKKKMVRSVWTIYYHITKEIMEVLPTSCRWFFLA